MAYDVKFLRGSQEGYEGLITKEATTFYLTESNLYLGALKLTSTNDVAAAVTRIAANETDIDNIQAELIKLAGDASVDGSIAKMIADAIKVVTDDLGDVDNLTTTNKTVVGAINEVKESVSTAQSVGAVTVELDSTGLIYTVKQGNEVVGTINIPKDMVVQSGSVEVDPEGQPEGTYIKLVLANVDEPLYIDVGTLVDIYTAKANATQVQIAIDSNSREISASIVAGSIGTTELADDAVTTAKIADANVTKAKLSTALQGSIDKADASASQTALDAVATRVSDLEDAVGETGSISDAIATAKQEAIDAAAADATTKANAAKADTAEKIAAEETARNEAIEATETELKAYADQAETDAVATANAYADGLASNYDAAGSASTAETNAKAYTNEALTWGSF